nr:energy-coupling factor transporter transmembrane protein EcfT [Propionibacterium sp.]
MDAARALLGVHVPGTTLWHRLGIGWKYLVFLLLVVPAVAGPHWAVSLGVLGLSLVLVASTRAPLRLAWGLPWGVAVLFGALAGYQALVGRWELGVTLVAGMLTALYGARLLLLTTPLPVLIDALVRAARPLRRLGLDPERFGLAVAIMVRSVPFVAGAFGEVRDAARARGLDRHPLALAAPVVIQAVAYARATGEALAARGFGESDR